jgi:uncharacterized protein YgiM (DUF1202 family)
MAHRSPLSFRNSLAIAAAASLAALSGAPIAARAQVAGDDQAVKEVENSKYSTAGLIASNAVFVRCGPGENYYPTIKLDKGARVTVVGAKFDWLKIVPPEGSFCYVARLYVDRYGDGKKGRVNKDAINVRAGSSLSALKIGILCELSQGEEVEILGEEQEYFKIKPPAKAYLYVNKKFVEPDPDAKPVAVAKADQPAPPTPPTQVTPEPTNPDFGHVEPVKPETVRPEAVKPEAVKPEPTPPQPDAPKFEEPVKPEAVKPEPLKPEVTDTPKADEPVKPEPVSPKPQAPKIDAPKPETLNTPEAAEAAYDKAEQSYLSTRTQPIEQQPVADLVKQYEALAKSDALPESMRRVAESRLGGLKARAVAQAEIQKLKAAESTFKQRQRALVAEQEELQKRIAETTVKVYTAVGTLQPSSLQVGQGTLFRITDPATGRTVCYLRSADPKTAAQLGQFVGVKGAIQDEQRLGARVITPTEITAVDPGKVHQTVTAQIIPPSLIPREPVANTDLRPAQP